jgi:predicted dehydrogenase
VAASTQAHYEIAEFFLKKRIPVLVEKPIAATAELGLRLCELSEKNNVVFSVGHIERFNPAYNYLKDNHSQIKYLELNRLAPFRVRGSDVSVLHDLMIHDLDLVNYIFNQKIVNKMVFGQKIIRPTVDDVSVLLTLESGIQVHIQNSRITPQIIRNYRAVMNDRVILMNTATSEADVLLPDESQPDLHKIEKWVVGKVDALALEIEHFIAAVKKEKPVAITGHEATAALKTIEDIVAQIEGV